MGQVNGRRETCVSERNFRPAHASGSEQPAAKNGGIPGLQRADRPTERVSAWAVLAEGEELSTNPLRAYFNDLRTTENAVEVDWRIWTPVLGCPSTATAGGPARGLQKRASIRASSRAATPISWCAVTPPPKIRPAFLDHRRCRPGCPPSTSGAWLMLEPTVKPAPRGRPPEHSGYPARSVNSLWDLEARSKSLRASGDRLTLLIGR
jgi:hypothetical protein